MMTTEKTPTEKTSTKPSGKATAAPSAQKVSGPASYFPSIERTYGQPIDHWMTIITTAAVANGSRKHMKLVTHLKTEHGIGHGHPNALVSYWLTNN